MHTRTLTTAAALTALLLIGCGGSSSSTPTSPTPGTGGGATAADVTITINGMDGNQSFSPNPATVKAGQTVAWKNADSTTHNPIANGGSFNAGNIGAGATSGAIMMSTAGTFDYHCGIHPTMVGTLTVTQ
jgi:plastocyanin